MPVSGISEKLIFDLKRKIKQLEKQEALQRKKLKQAIANASKVAQTYKSRLSKKIGELKDRHAVEKAAACAKAALDAERKVVKDAEKLCKELKTAVTRMDQKHLKRIVKNVAKKARKSTLVSKIIAMPKRKPAKAATLKRKIKTTRKKVGK